MLNKEVCKKCRQGSADAIQLGYDVNRELVHSWACPALIAVDEKDSDTHTVSDQWFPPKGCQHALEHAITESVSASGGMSKNE